MTSTEIAVSHPGVAARVALAMVRREEVQLRTEKKSSELPAVYLTQTTAVQCVAPSALLWCALFGALKRSEHEWVKDRSLAAHGGLEVKFTGALLDQNDLTLWLALLRIAQHKPLGEKVHLRGSDLLAILDLSDCGSAGRRAADPQRQGTGGDGARDRIEAALRRLVEGTVNIRFADGKVFIGHLVDAAFRGRGGEDWSVRLGRDLTLLFAAGAVRISTSMRVKLRGKPLALWLQAYLESHGGRPYATRIQTLRNLSGSTSELKEFGRLLRRALGHLTAAYKIEGATLDWEMKEGLVRLAVTWSVKGRL